MKQSPRVFCLGNYILLVEHLAFPNEKISTDGPQKGLHHEAM